MCFFSLFSREIFLLASSTVEQSRENHICDEEILLDLLRERERNRHFLTFFCLVFTLFRVTEVCFVECVFYPLTFKVQTVFYYQL